MKVTIGIRVAPEVEVAGLDIAEHGAFGYAEHFEGIGFEPARRAARVSVAAITGDDDEDLEPAHAGSAAVS